MNYSLLISKLNELTATESNRWYLYNGEYWTRSPGSIPKMSYPISSIGSIGQNSIYNGECAVRPAITLVL